MPCMLRQPSDVVESDDSYIKAAEGNSNRSTDAYYCSQELSFS